MGFLDFLFPPRVDEAVLRDVTNDEFIQQLAPRLVPETRPGTVALLLLDTPLAVEQNSRRVQLFFT